MNGVIFMTARQMLIKEIEVLPQQTVDEVYNFVSFLKMKKLQETDANDMHLASENALAADWLLPEEDIAWANL